MQLPQTGGRHVPRAFPLLLAVALLCDCGAASPGANENLAPQVCDYRGASIPIGAEWRCDCNDCYCGDGGLLGGTLVACLCSFDASHVPEGFEYLAGPENGTQCPVGTFAELGATCASGWLPFFDEYCGCGCFDPSRPCDVLLHCDPTVQECWSYLERCVPPWER